MGFFVPILGVAGSTIVRKAVVTGGVLTVTYTLVENSFDKITNAAAKKYVEEYGFTMPGTVVADFIPGVDSEDIRKFEQAFIDLGATISDIPGQAAGAIGNATLDVAKFIGPAIADGVENTYDYIRDKLRGKEPDIIAAVTVGALTVLAGVYLFNAAKRGTMTYTE